MPAFAALTYRALPRTYLFAADGTAQAVSGKLDAKMLASWLTGKASTD